MDSAINSPGRGNNVDYGINDTDKRYFKKKLRL